jgi:hypothetical protein
MYELLLLLLVQQGSRIGKRGNRSKKIAFATEKKSLGFPERASSWLYWLPLQEREREVRWKETGTQAKAGRIIVDHTFLCLASPLPVTAQQHCHGSFLAFNKTHQECGAVSPLLPFQSNNASPPLLPNRACHMWPQHHHNNDNK